MMKQEILTTEETAQYLKVHIKTVYRLILSEKLKASRVGRHYRIRMSDIQEYLRSS